MSKMYFKRCSCVLAAFFLAAAVILSSPGTTCAASDVNVNWTDLKQEIDGFGASQAADVYGDLVYNLTVRDQVMDLLFSQTNGIGLSILRCEVGCGLNMPTIEPQDGVWNFQGSEAELWIMNQAKSRGVDKIFSTVWSPPAWMKTNNSLTYGGYLKKNCYQKFADYLAEYVNGYKKYHNIDIYAVSIANEPEYPASWQSCLWTGAMFRDFIGNYLKPTFQNKAVPAKVIVGEKSTWTEDVALDSLNDPTACSRVDIVAGHQYHGSPALFTTSRAKGKRVWETEVSDTGTYKSDISDGIAWAKRVSSFMTTAEANAFNYWLGACAKNNNESLIRINSTNNTFETTKRFYAYGNFSRFIRPGYVRIGATENPVSGVYFSAYKDPRTGNFSIVAINDSTASQVVNINPMGFTAGKLTPYLTSASANLQQQPDIALSNGKFTVTLDAKSVTTFVGSNGSSPAN